MFKIDEMTGEFESFNSFAKVGDDRIVTAIAADTDLDTQRDRFTKECLKKMADEFMTNENGRNMREMHENIAAGNALHSIYIEEDMHKAKWVLTSEVTDDSTWRKIKKSTLKGQSVGGKVVECYYINQGQENQIRVITDAYINEVSYVDRPAQPGMNIQPDFARHSVAVDVGLPINLLNGFNAGPKGLPVMNSDHGGPQCRRDD